MALRLIKTIDQTPKAKPKKQGAYLDFVRRLPCCVTGSRDVEAAHLSFAATEYGHYGRGKQSKASDRWALPLSREQHRLQHSMNEAMFWNSKGVDPHVLALTLYGLWTEHGADALGFAEAVIYQHVLRKVRQ